MCVPVCVCEFDDFVCVSDGKSDSAGLLNMILLCAQ